MKTVGVFDSGVGGLSVLRALRAEMPGVHFIYVADSAHAPYGERAASFVAERALEITLALQSRYGIDALVVACNTATAHAVETLRNRYPALPIVGVEPALKPAAAASRSGHVGVLATRGTVDSARFARLRSDVQAGAGRPVRFTAMACDGLADAIERQDVEAMRRLCQRYTEGLLAQVGNDAAIDTVVLGCTHYPFAAEVLREHLGPGITLVDTGAAVARRTRMVLGIEPAPLPATEPGQEPDKQIQKPVAGMAPGAGLTLLATGSTEALSKAASQWLDAQVPVGQLGC